MKDIAVYEGHFWINIDGVLSQKRRKELEEDLHNTDKLLIVNGEFWARMETPHPTKRQKNAYKAVWKPEEIEDGFSMGMPEIKK